jgi:hypothetical protein
MALEATLDPIAFAERDAAVREFAGICAEFQRWAVRGARALERVRATCAHRFANCASLEEFAERHGMAAGLARDLQGLRLALDLLPRIAGEVESGDVPVASAAILGQVASGSDRLRAAEDWLGRARTMVTRDFLALFFRRRDEDLAGEPVSSLRAYVTRRARDDLSRARDLVSRRGDRPLTLGQTLGVVVDEWLEANDPLRKEGRRRRVGDTSRIPDRRYVPVEADRAVRRRSDDRCIVPLCCNRIWLQRSHRVAHANGGSREADNLDLLCAAHHVLYEDGEIRIVGPPDRPVVTDPAGRPLTRRNAPIVVRTFHPGDVGEADEGLAEESVEPPDPDDPDGSDGPHGPHGPRGPHEPNGPEARPP